MKTRARHIVMGTALAGGGVVSVLVAVHWGAVRDHVEAWHFQLTRETEIVAATSSLKGQSAILVGRAYGGSCGFPPEGVLRLLAAHSGLPVVYDPQDCAATLEESRSLLPSRLCWWPQSPPPADYWNTLRVEITPATSDLAMALLGDNGYRVLEQRFPRRAYVVIREAERHREEELKELRRVGTVRQTGGRNTIAQ